jgi:hypothetical protein
LYLGLRHMEWLFITCHNYWIVCRLVRDDNYPYLAYSPKISIENSSEPFRAFLGATLSVVEGVSVANSAYNPDMQLDTIGDEGDGGPPPKDDIDDASGLCHGGLSRGQPPVHRRPVAKHARGIRNTDSDLMVRLLWPISII